MNTNDHDAEVLEHARQRAERAHTAGFDVDASEYSLDGYGPIDGPVSLALEALGGVVPPAGRARLSNDQLVGIANAHATIALVRAVQTSNAIAAIQLGVPALEHDSKTSTDEKTRERIGIRNRLRRVARRGLGLL